ncbi:MAG: hypothetical protein ACRD5H_17295, partial [Nitrososphaerales archaeon]
LRPLASYQDDNFLDLTRIKRSPANESKTTGKGQGVGAVVGHTSKSRSNPLKVTLLSLHKQSYQLGDEIIYDVSLENISNSIAIIPWSPDQDAVKPDENKTPPGYLVANLSLVIIDEISGEQFIAGQGLYGSTVVPRSLKRIAPKQSVRIRVPGRLVFYSADEAKRISQKLPYKVEVRARFSFLQGHSASQVESIASTNSIFVDLKKRQV